MKNWVRMTAAAAALLALGGCGVFKGGTGNRTPVVGQRIPILPSESESAADAAQSGLEVLVPAAAANPSWTQPGGNASKSMGHLELGGTLTKAWSVQIAGGNKRERLAASPVVDENRLFVVDVEGTVTAFAADSGSKLWAVSTVKDTENKSARFGGGASVEAGRVYASNGLGDVVALDATNGNEVWRKRPGGPLRGSPTVANGQVYVVTQDNQLIALNQEDGAVVWTVSASLETQGVFGVAAPAVAQGTVVAGFSSGELNAYRYENGLSLWTDVLSRSSISTSVSSLSDIDAEPVMDRGRVYAVGQGGRMVAMDVTSGTRLWEQNVAGISTPWVAGEWIFIVTDDARLLCLSRGSGKIRWISQLKHYRNEKKKTNPISWTGPILAGNRLVLVNSRGEIVSASLADGSVTSTLETKSEVTLSPIVANNMLYVLDDKGRLTAYR
ncbi:PQQ-binding-like beta-propeller repeat protein [Sphingomonas sp. AOB5]|uniref:PQQ-like beta-propeller repeat protein n=1 Tax=Sphingomonas sp. AOB5 TaxID=3034017 RepID=UPI0023F97A83|nr:PQQ-like beta-propeller repeat protein [Sphingomonas sp. AOB5]MDF7774622.1 PQQ-binding-like beta-propeller repeat protein [Sphingomonas sp. AOB5]